MICTEPGWECSVVVYATAPAADVPPVRTITSSDLSQPFGIAVDGADRIFVASTGLHSIVVFDIAAAGNVVPFRKIQGSNTGLNNPLGVAVRY